MTCFVKLNCSEEDLGETLTGIKGAAFKLPIDASVFHPLGAKVTRKSDSTYHLFGSEKSVQVNGLHVPEDLLKTVEDILSKESYDRITIIDEETGAKEEILNV